MNKPKLQNSAIPSTGLTKNLLTLTGNRQIAEFNTSIRQTTSPMISSFFQPPQKRLQQLPIFEEKLGLEQQQSNWKNTTDIEIMIKKRIQTDISLSCDNIRTILSQKFFLAQEKVCAQEFMEIPRDVKAAFQRMSEGSRDGGIQLVFGYLQKAHSIYYIIETTLFIYNIEDLKNKQFRSGDMIKNEIRIRPNCRKIHQIQIFNNKLIPQEFNSQVLVFQYPYQIQLCCYSIQERQSEDFKNNSRNTGKTFQSNKFTIVSLDTRIPLESALAEFITPTPQGELLYLDQTGQLNCFSFTLDVDKRLRKNTKKENSWRKKKFISQNQAFIKSAKQYFWKIFDFRHSLYLPKRKNISLIYDQKRNRVYTLTVQGDRATMVQQLRKTIRVYDFYHKEKSTEVDCIWHIEEEQLIAQVANKTSSKIKGNIFSISKVQRQYNQEADLSCILTNGIKILIQITQQGLKIIRVTIPPDYMKLFKQTQNQKQRLLQACTLSFQQQKKIINIFKQENRISSAAFMDSTMKSYIEDRNININLSKKEKKIIMFMSLKRAQDSQKNDVYPITWKNNRFFLKLVNEEIFPKQNFIFQAASSFFLTKDSGSLLNLQEMQLKNLILKQNRLDLIKPLLKDTHEYFRQVYCAPRMYTYLSSKFITTFTLIRPIDFVYYFSMNKDQIFIEKYLELLIDISPQEICCMLLQIYSDSDATYYIPKHYKQKIQGILKQMTKNTKRQEAAFSTRKSQAINPINFNEKAQKKHKQLFQFQTEDQVLKLPSKLSEQSKAKIRRLFSYFSKQQDLKKDSNQIFSEIKIQNSDKSIENRIQNLTLQQRNQLKSCLIYLSRVFYPFWNSTLIVLHKNQQLLRSIKNKIQQMRDIVHVLKYLDNPFHKHLNEFITKSLQMLQIFQQIAYLPEGLTLQIAVSKNIDYFQPLIFGFLRKQCSPQILNAFKDKFPIYITKEFQKLIRLLMHIRVTYEVSAIKDELKRLPEYPRYFIEFLKQQKNISDVSFLKIKGQQKYQAPKIFIPQMPFDSMIQYIFSCVKNDQIKFQEKYKYLKQAKKRIDQKKDINAKKRQIMSISTIRSIEQEYDRLYKSLKLQQHCKEHITRMIEDERKKKLSSSQQNEGIFKRFFGKLSTETQKDKNQRMEYKVRYNSEFKKKEYTGYEEIFNKLDYVVLSPNDLKELIDQLDSTKLNIALIHMFPQMFSHQIRVNGREQDYLKLKYHDFVRKAMRTCSVSLDSKNSTQSILSLSKYFKAQICDLLHILNMVKVQLKFKPLYDGMKEELIKINEITQFLCNKKQNFIYSICRQLADLGLNNQLIYTHLIVTLSSTLNERRLGQSMRYKLWTFDWCMLFDMIKKYKKSSLSALKYKTDEFLKIQAQGLTKHPHIEQFMRQNAQKLFRMINGQKQEQKKSLLF